MFLYAILTADRYSKESFAECDHLLMTLELHSKDCSYQAPRELRVREKKGINPISAIHSRDRPPPRNITKWGLSPFPLLGVLVDVLLLRLDLVVHQGGNSGDRAIPGTQYELRQNRVDATHN